MKSEDINKFNANSKQRQKEWKNQKQKNNMPQNSKRKNRWRILISKPLIVIYIIELLISIYYLTVRGFESEIVFDTVKFFFSFVFITVFIAYIFFVHEETKTNLPEPPRIQCPYCKSFATSKISTISRSTSTVAFGLASSKIGKQWHCKNCNSDF